MIIISLIAASWKNKNGTHKALNANRRQAQPASQMQAAVCVSAHVQSNQKKETRSKINEPKKFKEKYRKILN